VEKTLGRIAGVAQHSGVHRDIREQAVIGRSASTPAFDLQPVLDL
jgi:hypothetical protein